jgi:transcriptional regulator GlxA family with amidase domain
MPNTIGILLFDGVEELDFGGPWEVFGVSAMLNKSDRVVAIAEKKAPIRCSKGLSVNPDHSFERHPMLDVLVVPGGLGTRREVDNPVLLGWLREAASPCRWVTSVCTGALLLHAAGLAKGKRVTTHWNSIARLKAMGDVEVLDGPRYVRDGNLVTAAGISAGIDMALWLVGQLHGADFARKVQRQMQYEPAPPYAAEV